MKIFDWLKPTPLTEDAVVWAKQLVDERIGYFIVDGQQIPPVSEAEAAHLLAFNKSRAWRDLQECDRAELVRSGYRKAGGLRPTEADKGPADMVTATTNAPAQVIHTRSTARLNKDIDKMIGEASLSPALQQVKDAEIASLQLVEETQGLTPN
jgi:hypothetical protein